MNIINVPNLDGDKDLKVFHTGSNEEAAEHQRVMNARGAFSLNYMKEKGWGDSIIELDIQQIMEIRSQPGWKTP